jgi:S1-C subfamily serine protease
MPFLIAAGLFLVAASGAVAWTLVANGIFDTGRPAPEPPRGAGQSQRVETHGRQKEAGGKPNQAGDQEESVHHPSDILPDRALAHLKAATVFLKVEDRGRVQASGSGFVAQVEGDKVYVATNYHVVNPRVEIVVPRYGPHARRLPPALRFRRVVVSVTNLSVTAVFGSGTAGERTAPATLVAADPDHDLALLVVTGIGKAPRPLQLPEAPKLTELMPIYVFGFPFGNTLAANNRNPAITVGKGSVSSIRRNEHDQVTWVQIDGALNPGNSGGPVVDSQGRLVGVAVATIKGSSGIGLTIPAVQLKRFLGNKANLPPPHPVVANPPSQAPKAEDYKPSPPPTLPPIKPPVMVGKKVVVHLPDAIRDLAVGGGGRYLVLHLAARRRLALFDLAEAKIVDFLPVPDEQVRFAAGAQKLLVVLGDARIIQRWDLTTRKRETTAPLPFSGVIQSVSMGSASAGPLLVHRRENSNPSATAPVDFIDIQTLKPLTLGHPGAGRPGFSNAENVQIRASADGQVFAGWCTNCSPSASSLVLRDNRVMQYPIYETTGHVIPGPDGKVLYSARGSYTNEGRLLGDKGEDNFWFMPAHDPRYFLGFRQYGKMPSGLAKSDGVTIYRAGDTRPLLSLPAVEIPGIENTDPIAIDKRIHLVPAAQVIAVLPATNDQLVLYKVDADRQLAKAPKSALPAGQVVVPLPAGIHDVCVGGGGRFLVLHLPQLRRLAVFDVNRARVVQNFSLTSADVVFAAGQDALVVAYRASRLIERFSLTTYKRLAVAKLPVKQGIRAIGMGSASAGPLLVHDADAKTHSCALPLFVDLATLQPIDTSSLFPQRVNLFDDMKVRTSADGKTFCLYCNQVLFTFVVRDKTIRWSGGNGGAAHWVPGPDGSVIYAGADLYAQGGKVLQLTGPTGSWVYPACHGDCYFRWFWSGYRLPDGRIANKAGVSIHLPGDVRPIAILDDYEELYTRNFWKASAVALDQRIYLIPDVRRIVTIPASDDRLVLHRFDLDDILAKSGKDFLVVTSRPPTSVRPGTTFTYQLTVKSNKGGLKYSLQAGPGGMHISKTGLVTWKVPSNHPGRQTTVIISVRDVGEQEVFHSFKIGVETVPKGGRE